MENYLKDSKTGSQVQKAPSQIFVGGLPEKTTEEVLHKYFSTFGHLTECRIVINHETQQSKGFAFVSYFDPKVAEKVLSQKTHKLLKKSITLKAAQSKEDAQASLQEESSRRMFVGNIPFQAKESEVRKLFSKYGEVEKVDLKPQSGHGIVTFKDRMSVIKLLQPEVPIEIVYSGNTLECRLYTLQPKTRSNMSQKGNESFNMNNSEGGEAQFETRNRSSLLRGDQLLNLLNMDSYKQVDKVHGNSEHLSGFGQDQSRQIYESRVFPVGANPENISVMSVGESQSRHSDRGGNRLQSSKNSDKSKTGSIKGENKSNNVKQAYDAVFEGEDEEDLLHNVKQKGTTGLMDVTSTQLSVFFQNDPRSSFGVEHDRQQAARMQQHQSVKMGSLLIREQKPFGENDGQAKFKSEIKPATKPFAAPQSQLAYPSSAQLAPLANPDLQNPNHTKAPPKQPTTAMEKIFKNLK